MNFNRTNEKNKTKSNKASVRTRVTACSTFEMSTDLSLLVYKFYMSNRVLTHASPHACMCHFDISHHCLDGISIARVVFI